jgi:hypothetical protein
VANHVPVDKFVMQPKPMSSLLWIQVKFVHYQLVLVFFVFLEFRLLSVISVLHVWLIWVKFFRAKHSMTWVSNRRMFPLVKIPLFLWDSWISKIWKKASNFWVDIVRKFTPDWVTAVFNVSLQSNLVWPVSDEFWRTSVGSLRTIVLLEQQFSDTRQ